MTEYRLEVSVYKYDAQKRESIIKAVLPLWNFEKAKTFPASSPALCPETSELQMEFKGDDECCEDDLAPKFHQICAAIWEANGADCDVSGQSFDIDRLLETSEVYISDWEKYIENKK